MVLSCRCCCVCLSRQHVVLDDISDDDDDDDKIIRDEDVKKSLPRPSSAPSDHRHVSEQPSTTNHHSKLTEKLLKWLCAPSAHPATSSPGRQSPPCRGTAPQRRRFLRVVRDEHAPPPERVTDNPNIICRYTQARPPRLNVCPASLTAEPPGGTRHFHGYSGSEM